MLYIIGLCHCSDLPSKTEVESSINRTIDEVERLIRQNSTLPYLTRHEIIDILFNITSKNLETYENKSTMEEARKIYQKALMVVLPYNAEDSKENIKDLHIKPPIVQIIADPFPNLENFEAGRVREQDWKNKKLETNILVQEMYTQHDKKKQSLENFVVTYAPKENLNEEHTHNPEQTQLYRNHKETYSEASTKIPVKETLNDSAPIKFSFNLENLQKREREQPTIAEKQITTTRQPMFQESSLREIKNKEVYVVYSTGATKTIPPRTVETKKHISMFNLEPLSSEREKEMISRPLKYNENVLSIDQWRYNAPITQRERESTTMLTKLDETDTLFKRIRDKQQLFPIVTTQMPLENIAPTNKIKYIPNSSKITSEKIQIVNAESAPIFVTPMPFSSPLPSSSSSSTLPAREREKLKYNSTYIYNLNSGDFRKITTTMRPEVMELLASIGLRPENATNVEDVFRKSNQDLEIKSRIPNSNGLVYTSLSSLTTVRNSLPINAQNTFENPVLEIGKGMNNLTPDVQLLFQKFGLQTSNVTTTSSPLLKTSNTNSYTNFKPLPTFKIKNGDMKEFLAKFGLDVSDNRQKKAMSISTERPSLIEVVPDNMRQILENIGLISRKTSGTISKMENMEPTKMTQFHVFKPHEVHVKDEGERMKINELLDKIRLVQEGKASATDVRKVADNLLATTKTLKDGPDPLSLEEMIKTYNVNVKNEIKRQQNLKETIETTTNDDRALSAPTESANVSSTTMTTMATIPTTSDSTKDDSNFRDTLTPTVESLTSANTNLAALEESFGGTTRAPDPVLPTKRRNGLYFLLDWNTFLEVGDEENEKVNLRFEPKVGDRTRFLPVSVP
ncbi:hypothetical protein G5I_01902 [Acromyrmex echinatior]|uniref:Uncharacterized protein n=2 Tax=Acromyrmex echinatior TaxID=103372 RepID=F4W8W0_ACREC|nr:hypothetical protein G5I_01902 [Acromyrmex echinatior]